MNHHASMNRIYRLIWSEALGATGTDLQGIEGKLSGHYALGSNIDASVTASWNSNGAATPVYAGFTPIGTQAAPLTGTFEGLGHTVTNLTIDRPTMSNVGLIGDSSKASVIRDVGLIGGSVAGASYVGALVGQSGGSVSESYATGSVAGTSAVGGLLGQSGGAVSESYASGRVTSGGNLVGGLVGQNNSAVSDSYATGSVNGDYEVGGLVGRNQGALSDSYATGTVQGEAELGGLVGYNLGAGAAISVSYAKGLVIGLSTPAGGLVGKNTGTVAASSYWDELTSGQSTSAGGTGLNTWQLQNPADLPGFNFTTTLGASGNNWVTWGTYPMLACEYTTRIDNAHQLQLMALNPAATYVLSQNIDASTTGSGTDVWSGSTGFVPIGSSGAPFTGTLDGLLHTVSNLRIASPDSSNVGLFGVTGPTSVIEEVGLTGSVSGSSYVGGLVGKNQGTVTDAYFKGSVKGSGAVVGGLVGQSSGAVGGSYATGTVASTFDVAGGLVGQNNGTVTNGYAVAAVTGELEVGGLVGQNQGSVSDSYARGSSQAWILGPAGEVGGLVGYNFGVHASIDTSYAWDKVTGYGSNVGGVAGANTGTITDSYWGNASGAPQTLMTANFPGFNFTTTPGATGNNWVLVDVDGSLNNAGGAQGATFPMLASEYSTIINNAHQLQLIAMNLRATYTLGQDIDTSATGTSTDVWFSSGFIPVGNSNVAFAGTLNGLGHTISGLTINLPSNTYVGLFGVAGTAAVIEDVGLMGGSVSGSSYVGDLVGKNQGLVNQVHGAGAVSGIGNFVGGLIAYNSGTLNDGYAAASVSGTGNQLGGLVGYNSHSGTITASDATSDVIATGGGVIVDGTYHGNAVGGLVGTNAGILNTSYATGSVSGDNDVGGLAGVNTGNVRSSYATGAVSGGNQVGGVVGYNTATIIDTYASGTITGANGVGGLAGTNAGTVSDSYATGQVSGSSNAGGLLGGNWGTVTGGFWNVTTSGQTTSGGGMGLTTAQMETKANFIAAGWDFTTVWYIPSNSYPLLQAFMTP